MDTEPIEIAEHRGPDGDEVAELALGSHGLSFLFALLSPKAKAEFSAVRGICSREFCSGSGFAGCKVRTNRKPLPPG